MTDLHINIKLTIFLLPISFKVKGESQYFDSSDLQSLFAWIGTDIEGEALSGFLEVGEISSTSNGSEVVTSHSYQSLTLQSGWECTVLSCPMYHLSPICSKQVMLKEITHYRPVLTRAAGSGQGRAWASDPIPGQGSIRHLEHAGVPGAGQGGRWEGFPVGEGALKTTWGRSKGPRATLLSGSKVIALAGESFLLLGAPPLLPDNLIEGPRGRRGRGDAVTLYLPEGYMSSLL